MKSGNKYKIGKSEDTSSRLKALQTGNQDIKIILYAEIKNKADIRSLPRKSIRYAIQICT